MVTEFAFLNNNFIILFVVVFICSVEKQLEFFCFRFIFRQKKVLFQGTWQNARVAKAHHCG